MSRSPRDWFRKTSWSIEDQQDFRARLKRARMRSRPQYLKLQASHLVTAGLPEPALLLLDEFLSSPDTFFLPEAYSIRGQALTDLGRPHDALEAFRQAITLERSYPNIRTYAALAFAELVVASGQSELYPEALSALGTLPKDGALFPAIEYREATVRALIAEATGDSTTARREATRALRAAAVERSSFVRHPTVGLVRTVDPLTHAHLEELCR